MQILTCSTIYREGKNGQYDKTTVNGYFGSIPGFNSCFLKQVFADRNLVTKTICCHSQNKSEAANTETNTVLPCQRNERRNNAASLQHISGFDWPPDIL